MVTLLLINNKNQLTKGKEEIKMKTKKTKDELIREAVDFELKHVIGGNHLNHGYYLYMEAAGKWDEAGDSEKARKYCIKAAEYVTSDDNFIKARLAENIEWHTRRINELRAASKPETEKTIDDFIQEAVDFELGNKSWLEKCRIDLLKEVGYKWEKAGNAEKARAYFIKAAEQVWNPNDGEEAYRRGLLYERAGELTKAVESFEAAINNWDTEIEGYDLHGDYRDTETGKRVASSLRVKVNELQEIIARRR